MKLTARHILGFSALIAASLAATAPAQALRVSPAQHYAQTQEYAHSDYTRYAQRTISASEAKSIARRAVPGSVYVDMSRNGKVYKVRVKKDGRIIDVFIDAASGRVLN